LTRETVTLQPAFVLHQRDYRDSSRLIDCLCRDYGRVALVARGVRRPGSKLRPVLMPFQQVLLSWVRRGELGTLTGAELVDTRTAIAGSALLSAWYLNEVLLRLVQSGEAQPEIFATYARTLPALADPARHDGALRRFEKRLLEHLGYGVAFDIEGGSARRVEPDAVYRYRAQAGPMRLAEQDDGAAVQGIAGHVLLAIAREDFADPQVRHVARRVLGEALAAQLGERPLRVRAVARAMARATPVRSETGA
jgi:DNA repair protein RecO (recombination protein O)